MQCLLLTIFFGGILGPSFLTYGISRISSSTASLLLNLEAVFTSMIAWCVFKEHFEKKIVYGLLFILLGCFVLSLSSISNSNLALSVVDSKSGFMLICFACLSWGIDNNLTRKISHSDPILLASLKGLIAGIANLTLGKLIGENVSLSLDIVYAALFGFLGIGISLVAFIISLGTLGTARTGAVFSTAPILGAIISIFLLGESITLPLIIALSFMLCGCWFHFCEDHEHEHFHDSLFHEHEHVHDDHHIHEHASLTITSSVAHTHPHKHVQLIHKHPHFPDLHHQHTHEKCEK